MGEKEKPDKKEKEGVEEKKPRGKIEGKKHMKSKKWLHYDMVSKGRKRKTCPKCGSGVFLAQHKDRLSCGNCSYTEFIKRVQTNLERPK